MSDPTKQLSACIERHCKISAKSVSLANRLRAFAEKIRDKTGTVYPKDIAEMKSLVAEMRKHKVTSEQIRCTAANCSKEYAKNAEAMMRKAGEHMAKVVDMAERMMKDMKRREGLASKAKAAKATSSKSKSSKATSKSSKAKTSKAKTSKAKTSKPKAK